MPGVQRILFGIAITKADLCKRICDDAFIESVATNFKLSKDKIKSYADEIHYHMYESMALNKNARNAIHYIDKHVTDYAESSNEVWELYYNEDDNDEIYVIGVCAGIISEYVKGTEALDTHDVIEKARNILAKFGITDEPRMYVANDDYWI